MGVLMMIFAALGGLIGTVAVGLLKDEATAWLPSLNRWILSLALSRVPSADRDRYAEEWSAHILDYPGKLSQLFQSIRFLRAGMAMEEFDIEFVRRKRIAIAICFSLSFIAQTLADSFVGTGHNFWIEHLFSFAYFATTIWYGWAVYWLIRLKEQILGER